MFKDDGTYEVTHALVPPKYGERIPTVPSEKLRARRAPPMFVARRSDGEELVELVLAEPKAPSTDMAVVSRASPAKSPSKNEFEPMMSFKGEKGEKGERAAKATKVPSEFASPVRSATAERGLFALVEFYRVEDPSPLRRNIIFLTLEHLNVT